MFENSKMSLRQRRQSQKGDHWNAGEFTFPNQTYAEFGACYPQIFVPCAIKCYQRQTKQLEIDAQSERLLYIILIKHSPENLEKRPPTGFDPKTSAGET